MTQTTAINTTANKIISGIYSITSPSGRVYIGQSTDIPSRWRHYKSLNCEKQPLIYRSLLKYGAKAHKFKIVYRATHLNYNHDALNYIEQQIITNLRSKGTKLLNLDFGWPTGHKRSPETREKLRQLNLGKKMLPHVKEALIRANTGSKRLVGRKLSEDHIKKTAAANKGKKRSPEQIRKQKAVALALGFRPSKECIAKSVATNTGRAQTSEHKLLNSLANRGEGNQKAITTEDMVKEIRGLYKRNHPERGRKALSVKYGISISGIQKIVSKTTWAHI